MNRDSPRHGYEPSNGHPAVKATEHLTTLGTGLPAIDLAYFVDAIADKLAQRLTPRLLGELRQQLEATGKSNSGKQLVSVRELSKLIGISVNTIHSRVADGLIPAIKVGRLLRFEPNTVLETLRAESSTNGEE